MIIWASLFLMLTGTGAMFLFGLHFHRTRQGELRWAGWFLMAMAAGLLASAVRIAFAILGVTEGWYSYDVIAPAP